MLYMKYRTLTQIEKRIEKIKKELQNIEQMRPGSLTCQYRNPKDKTGAYYQISYTHKMKSRTEYVRPEYVAQIRKQVSQYKGFKQLVEEWIELAIQHSKMQIDRAKKDK